jgi:hypothetical protein
VTINYPARIQERLDEIRAGVTAPIHFNAGYYCIHVSSEDGRLLYRITETMLTDPDLDLAAIIRSKL